MNEELISKVESLKIILVSHSTGDSGGDAEYKAIVIENANGDDFRVVAEFVEVLG